MFAFVVRYSKELQQSNQLLTMVLVTKPAISLVNINTLKIKRKVET